MAGNWELTGDLGQGPEGRGLGTWDRRAAGNGTGKRPAHVDLCKVEVGVATLHCSLNWKVAVCHGKAGKEVVFR